VDAAAGTRGGSSSELEVAEWTGESAMGAAGRDDAEE
jgi:hypothetical protein